MKLYIKNLVENFSREDTPLKVRKVELMDAVGMPLDQMYIFMASDLSRVYYLLNQEITSNQYPVVVRFACIPNRYSMPMYYLENRADAERIVVQINEMLNKDSSIRSIIIQSATPIESAVNKISGRYSLEGINSLPVEEILELYKGSRSTSILNTLATSDPGYVSFSKRIGGLLKPDREINTLSNIKISELRDVYERLARYKEKMTIVKDVISYSQEKLSSDNLVSFEFSYRDGKLVFLDID